MADQAPQTISPKTGIAAGVAAVLVLAAAIVKPWEGKENDPYRDIVGVLTVCYGHTGGIENRRYTDAECDALLGKDLAEAHSHVKRCITKPLPVGAEAAFISAAYNIGPKVVCGSTLQRKANAGDIKGACGQLLNWVYAGGKKVKGLVNRRQAEYKVCMQ